MPAVLFIFTAERTKIYLLQVDHFLFFFFLLFSLHFSHSFLISVSITSIGFLHNPTMPPDAAHGVTLFLVIVKPLQSMHITSSLHCTHIVMTCDNW